MTPHDCLRWCREHGATMTDRKTLRHVVEWIANKATEAARTPEDTAAVTAAYVHATVELAKPEQPK